MHASEAFLNGAGEAQLELLNTLRASAAIPSTGSAEERQVDEERQHDTTAKPGGFKNDPDDPTNPNEVREHHLQKVKANQG